MARKPRVQYPGAIYHVMNRGDRRELIFHDDEDRRKQSTMPLSWIAQRLAIGTRGYLSWLLYQAKEGNRI